MSEIRPLTLVSGYSLGVLISEHVRNKVPEHSQNLSDFEVQTNNSHLPIFLFLLQM